MTTRTTGFLYIATGKRFIAEAIQSVRSLKAHMPSVNACCFTDDVESARPWFDQVFLIDNPYRNFFEKIPPLSRTPYDQTIFVDTDTTFAAPMLDVFHLLDTFELAVVSDPFWCELPGLPACFAQMNTGLIAYQKSPRVLAFFAQWFSRYEEDFKNAGAVKSYHDQRSFQEALYRSDLRFYVLPNEYNVRLTCPQLLRIWAPARMLHARHRDIAKLGARLNAKSDVRVVWPNMGHFIRNDLFVVDESYDRILQALLFVPRKLIKLLMGRRRA
jgi:hypothetical protein